LSLNAAKAVLIPVMADSFAIQGVELMKDVIKRHEEDYGVSVKIVGLAFLRIKDNVNQSEFMSQVVNAWGKTTFEIAIRENEWYRIANGKRVTIEETPAHKEVKEEFGKFVAEFIRNTK
jgi:cellulose biosynthesis protein BcsQ